MAERFAYATALLGDDLDEQWQNAGQFHMRRIQSAMHGDLDPRELDPEENDEWLVYGRSMERLMVQQGLPSIVSWLAMDGHAIHLDVLLATDPDRLEHQRGTSDSADSRGDTSMGKVDGRNSFPVGRSTPVEFDTETHRNFYDTVKEWVQEIFGESASTMDDRPAFILPIGTNGTVVLIQSVGDEDACADFYSWPLGEVQVDGEMAHRMLQINAMYRFGNLNLQTDGTVLFEYMVLKGALDKATFRSLAYMVATGSDDIVSELTLPGQ